MEVGSTWITNRLNFEVATRVEYDQVYRSGYEGVGTRRTGRERKGREGEEAGQEERWRVGGVEPWRRRGEERGEGRSVESGRS